MAKKVFQANVTNCTGIVEAGRIFRSQIRFEATMSVVNDKSAFQV